MAPEQVRILTITDRVNDYAYDLEKGLTAQGFRVKVDDRNEKIGKKIREGQIEKVPYMLVIGDKEAEADQVAVRHRAEGDLGVMSKADFASLLKDVVDSKAKK